MPELDLMPVYELQTLYYLVWKEREEDKKLNKDQQAAKALGNALENEL